MKYQYRIQGMHCKSCIEKIKGALQEVVESIEVTLVPPVLTIQIPAPLSLEYLNSRLSVVGNYRLFPLEQEKITEPAITPDTQEARGWVATYYPLFLIGAYITLISLVSSLNDNAFNMHSWMNRFMAGFFLVFSAFKLLDIKGFADAYSTYDLLARRWYYYGFIYPFLELTLGIFYLLSFSLFWTHMATIVLMSFSSLGVIKALIKKQKIRCACLGTVLNLPMSSITLVEDLAMVGMATAGLFFR